MENIYKGIPRFFEQRVFSCYSIVYLIFLLNTEFSIYLLKLIHNSLFINLIFLYLTDKLDFWADSLKTNLNYVEKKFMKIQA